jgi:hypothetical protein
MRSKTIPRWGTQHRVDVGIEIEDGVRGEKGLRRVLVQRQRSVVCRWRRRLVQLFQRLSLTR